MIHFMKMFTCVKTTVHSRFQLSLTQQGRFIEFLVRIIENMRNKKILKLSALDLMKTSYLILIYLSRLLCFNNLIQTPLYQQYDIAVDLSYLMDDNPNNYESNCHQMGTHALEIKARHIHPCALCL